MDRRAGVFRKQAARENRGREGVRRRYSEGLRRVAVLYLEARREEGWSLRRVAEEVGVNGWSLSRWVQAALVKNLVSEGIILIRSVPGT